uniref:DUF4283 domain-containing protein n=1 Tax=Davidia involucrata TaxID=16924 RepID=A0A5B7BES6_DAVIN
MVARDNPLHNSASGDVPEIQKSNCNEISGLHVAPDGNMQQHPNEIQTWSNRLTTNLVANNVRSAQIGEFPALNSNDPPIQAEDDQLDQDKGKTKPWNKLFEANRVKANGLQLHYVPSPVQDRVILEHHEVAEEIEKWSKSLVGYVMGGKPSFKMMLNFIRNRWKNLGNIRLHLLKSGMFLFEFDQEDNKQHVLDSGPWSFDNKPLLLKPWDPHLNLEKEGVESIPIWIRLPGLKFDMWSIDVLSKIVSKVGIPLFSDKLTASTGRISYARICVEVVINSTFPEEVTIEDVDGSVYLQKIEYEWLPLKCEECHVFGHSTTNCSNPGNQNVKPKSKQQRVRKEGATNQDAKDISTSVAEKFSCQENENHIANGGLGDSNTNDHKSNCQEPGPSTELDNVDPKPSPNGDIGEEYLPTSVTKIDNVYALPTKQKDLDCSYIFEVLDTLIEKGCKGKEMVIEPEIVGNDIVSTSSMSSAPIDKRTTITTRGRIRKKRQDRRWWYQQGVIPYMIKIVAWNIRGLNNPLKQKEVRKYARTQHPSIFCLSETKVKACNLDATFKKCFRDWNVIHNCPPQGV